MHTQNARPVVLFQILLPSFRGDMNKSLSQIQILVTFKLRTSNVCGLRHVKQTQMENITSHLQGGGEYENQKNRDL